MPRISRRLRLMLRLTLALLLVILLATGGIFLFLRSHAQELIAQYVHEASVQSGLDITVGTATVTLLPLPALAVSDVHVSGKDWEFRVASATVLPHISLLSGTLRPYSLTLLRPHLTGTLPAPLAQIPPQSPSMEEAESAARPTEWLDGLSSLLPHSCRLHIVQGEADVHGTDNASLDLSGLSSDLHLTHGTDLSGRLVWDFASFTPPEGLTTRLDGLSLEGETSLRDPLHRTPDMTLKGRVQREDWLASLNVTLRATLDETQQRVSMDLGGALRKDGLLIPASVAGLATRQAENDDIRLEDMRLALGKDSGVFHGTLCLGGPDLFSLNGRLLFSRASLTQWLGFARNLPPGLQISLDALTEGVMDFSMDGKGLRVPHVEATASGSHFSGTGGVTSWAQPVVALNLTAPLVNLGQALPESTGTLPAAPQYGHEAFTPRPGRPVIPGELDVGYDIRLNADTVQYGPLAITDAHVVIKQGLVDTRTRLEDTVLLVQGKMYGGTVKGETVLGGSPETPYAIRVRAQNVDGEPLARALPVIPVTGGRLRGDVDILSQGKKLDLFLSKLRGSVTVHAEKGNVRATGKNALLAYKTLDLSFKARSGQWKQGRLGLDGQWKAVLADQGLDAQANLSGTLWFGGAGGQFAFQNLPGEFSCQLAPERSFKPSGLRIQASGAFGCQAAAGKLSLNNGTVSALGVEAKGSVNLTASKDGPIWQGKISLSVPDTAKTLQLAGATPRLPEACRRLELETAFKGTPTSLSLSELRTRIDQTDVQGNLALNWRKGLELQYSLSTPALDLDRYLPHGEHPKS
ncbi:MAG: hypothetical protein J5861_03660, partial [Desulfovibrio sp.]|nr:hypothetical protein [Desulfovibrio sp.]